MSDKYHEGECNLSFNICHASACPAVHEEPLHDVDAAVYVLMRLISALGQQKGNAVLLCRQSGGAHQL